MSFISGLIVGGMIGCMCGLFIFALMITAGQTSEAERAAEQRRTYSKK
tara:strand:- start:1197 stop:1340 length:144 start_codon:yes stop_codon:yes gene_type:complete